MSSSKRARMLSPRERPPRRIASPATTTRTLLFSFIIGQRTPWISSRPAGQRDLAASRSPHQGSEIVAISKIPVSRHFLDVLVGEERRLFSLVTTDHESPKLA